LPAFSMIELGKTVPAPEDDDCASIRSMASDDGLSDDDDVPEVDPTATGKSSKAKTPILSLADRLRRHFLSKKFVVLSNVFGTMVAFFLAGQRVEK
jgi:hypothetical protein